MLMGNRFLLIEVPWKPPPPEAVTVKINFNGSVKNSKNRIGFLNRNRNGKLIYASSTTIQSCLFVTC